MTDPLFIPQSAAAALRLFHIVPDYPLARTLTEAPNPATIAAALGLTALPPNGAEVIRLDDIAALGLRDFLIQGHDVLPQAMEGPDTAWLDALHGHILIVHARIAGAGDVTLRPGPGLRPLGTFAQGGPPPTPLHIPDAERPEATGLPAPRTTAQRGGGAAVLVLLAIVVALIALALFGLPRWRG